eukprot:CAMPEP_0178410828 /NCGR_PEP_ID=MMETSP0689_2-20121128/21184_1 /TAXON_ID=160604 /ORGANISM="Amphidinium massartii, Strain CS-259" /LENGTH=228 /DNA_ID=CAMNT_0020032023 /DNA_START=158 /DNA_END=840 /DNA_ORIENTATION=+
MATILSGTQASLLISAGPVPDYLENSVEVVEGRALRIKSAFGALRSEDVDEASKDGDRTGATIWPGGLDLARTVAARNGELVKNRRVLELGCGTGVVGISAALAGAKSVTLTDANPELLRLADLNVRSNVPLAQQDSLQVERLRWGNAEDMDKWGRQEDLFDVVLGSDVAYEPEALPALLSTIRRMLRQSSAEAVAVLQLSPVVTDEGRGIAGVVKAAESNGFVVQQR